MGPVSGSPLVFGVDESLRLLSQDLFVLELSLCKFLVIFSRLDTSDAVDN
jgi:hypothetical protein